MINLSLLPGWCMFRSVVNIMSVRRTSPVSRLRRQYCACTGYALCALVCARARPRRLQFLSSSLSGLYAKSCGPRRRAPPGAGLGAISRGQLVCCVIKAANY